MSWEPLTTRGGTSVFGNHCPCPNNVINKTTGYSISYEAKSSFKILVVIWLLCMLVLINGYSGVLTSLLIVLKLKPIANTIK